MQQLQAVLDADPQIQADVCHEANHLLSVGWPEEMLPGMLASTKIPLLPKSELAELQTVTSMKIQQILTDLIHRC